MHMIVFLSFICHSSSPPLFGLQESPEALTFGAFNNVLYISDEMLQFVSTKELEKENVSVGLLKDATCRNSPVADTIWHL